MYIMDVLTRKKIIKLVIALKDVEAVNAGKEVEVPYKKGLIRGGIIFKKEGGGYVFVNKRPRSKQVFEADGLSLEIERGFILSLNYGKGTITKFTNSH